MSHYDNIACNLDYNRHLWGNREEWEKYHLFGFKWGGGKLQSATEISQIADTYLRPHVPKYDCAILEVAPGGGRFTAELLRYAGSLDLLDMNQVCLDICAERFRYYPTEMNFFLNDGKDCSMLYGKTYDLIASFDSMVHVHPDTLEQYFRQWARLLRPEGILFIDHSGKGRQEKGFRTAVTAELASRWVTQNGLTLLQQPFRNENDCITIAAAP